MSAAHVRRGGAATRPKRKPARKAAGNKVLDAKASKLAGFAFAAFLVVLGLIVLLALDIPAKAERAAGTAAGRAGFTVSGYQIVGLSHMDRRLIDEIVTSELKRAADHAGTAKAPQALVDVAGMRERLLQFGWVRDARISRRLPDGLVIDIVERTPAALWQNKGQLALIDSDGVVLDRVQVDKMPDLPLLVGPGANGQARSLAKLMDGVPTLKPQLASASWVGGRRWDLSFQSGETVALPEGAAAGTALAKFAKADKASGLLGRGIVRFDLRMPGKMIVRLPRAPGEPLSTPQPTEG